jgi:ribose transport system permease protein
VPASLLPTELGKKRDDEGQPQPRRCADRPTLGMDDSYLFPSIAAVVIGGTFILGGTGLPRNCGGAIVLTALVSVLLAKSAPDYARDIVYGVVILVIILLYGRQRGEA